MKILTVDIGTGTQDIYLYNSNLDMENNYKLIVASPTMIIHRRIKRATELGEPILLTGVTMGGGPSAWAAEEHLRAGYKIYATPEAARTLNDDLEVVRQMGVEVISEDEVFRLPNIVQRLQFLDFDFASIYLAFKTFGIKLDHLAAIAVGVFDHGNAPPKISDRQFRFDYLNERIRINPRLSSFAFRSEDVPEIMTRLKAVVDSANEADAPLVVMDTAPAAVLGASLDQKVAERAKVIIANVGNFHTLAFRLGGGGIEGLFEHHTGMVSREKLDNLLFGLADGTLSHDDVYGDHGHGALIYNPKPLVFGEGDFDIVVTGPRRGIFEPGLVDQGRKSLRVYYPAPFGDMMITGCIGLISATADLMPELAEPIRASLKHGNRKGSAPWDSD